VKRAFIAAGLVGGLVLACSGGEEPNQPPPAPVGGNTSQAGGGSGGATATAGSGGGGMAGGGTAGTGGAVGGTAGTGGSACAMDCAASGQVCEMASATCICPPFNPDHCPAAALCTDFVEDHDHCGNCETACAATSACNTGMCTPEPTDVHDTGTTDCERLNLVLSGTDIYFVNVGAGSVSSVPVAGGAATSLATGLTDAGAFTLDDTNIYVATGMTLSRIPIGGGTAEVVVTETAPIFDVAVQDDVLYYAVGTSVKSVDATADDGTGTVVGTPESSGEPQSVTVDGDNVFWGAVVAYNVEADSIATDAVVKLGASQGNLLTGHRALYTDGTHVYWVNGSTVERRVYDGTMAQENQTISIDSEMITAYVINATHVYLAAGGKIEKAALGEDALPLARGQGVVGSMVLDATNVYWSTDDCKIRKTAL